MITNLDYAILAMDAYNRAGDGLALELAVIGTFSLGAAKDEGSFFAQAYSSGSDIIISYRGTDNIIGDFFTGWLQGTGFLTSQAQKAAEFYRQVNGGSIETNPNITLTGHSLGGGLAGFG